MDLNSTERSFSVMDPTDESVFTAGLDDVTTMSKILHELHHASEHSVLLITKEGIRLVSADEKSFQVSAYFSASTFQRFKFDDTLQNQVTFRFILKDFIECLNLLRDDPLVEGDKIQLVDDTSSGEPMKTSLYIQYRKKGEPLKLRLENKSNYVINCDLKAFCSSSEFSPISLSTDNEYAMIKMDSRKLHNYVSGMDLVSSDFVHLSMGRGDYPLKLCTKSITLGEVELEIPATDNEIILEEIRASDNCLFSFTYKTQYMRPALDSLKNSHTVLMKCDSRGILCIEHFHGQKEGTLSNNIPNSNNYAVALYPTPGENKRSSVEYFLTSDAKPIDACLD